MFPVPIFLFHVTFFNLASEKIMTIKFGGPGPFHKTTDHVGDAGRNSDELA